MSDLTLWQINETVAQLLEMREDLIAETSEPDYPRRKEEIAAIDAELTRYLGEQLPAKVDGYIGIIRRDESIAEAATAEANRLWAIADRRLHRVRWLKSMAQAVMEARGDKKLYGSTGQYLLLRGNGGVRPLIISSESLIPDEYKIRRIVLGEREVAEVRRVLSTMSTIEAVAVSTALHQGAVSVDNDKVRKALEAGVDVPGARLDERGSHVEVR